MTWDAFFKARSINDELDAIMQLDYIISATTLWDNKDIDCEHNNRIRKDKIMLCVASKDDYNIREYILGEYIPINLATELKDTISRYRENLQKEFDELSSDYKNDEI